MGNLDLSIGIIDPSIQTQLRPEVAAPDTEYRTYNAPFGSIDYRSFLAENLGTKVENLAMTSGASMALTATFATFRSKGMVLLPKPGFPGYSEICRALGIDFAVYDVPLRASPAKAIKAAIKKHPSAGCVVINNPGNPYGTVMSQHETKALVEAATAADIIPIVDQTYHDLIFDAPAGIEAKVRIENSIQIFSLSKAPRLAAIRLGYLTAEQDTLQKIMSTHTALTLGVSRVSENIAFNHCKKMPDPLFSAERDFLLSARDHCLQILEGSGVISSYPKASPVIWIELPNLKIGGKEIARCIEHKLNISVVPCERVGVSDKTAFRCCFAINRIAAEHAFAGIAQVCHTEINRIT